MNKVLKVEHVNLPLMTSAGPRRDRSGRPLEEREADLREAVIVTVEPSEAVKARRRMLARQRAAGIA
jgi:hypothetical protein